MRHGFCSAFPVFLDDAFRAFEILHHQREEGENDVGFVGVADDIDPDGLFVPEQSSEGVDGVDDDHDENTNDASLFEGIGVVDDVEVDEIECEEDGPDCTC